MIYVAGSNPMVYTPGMFEWAMACKNKTWNKKAKDVAARMYILADLLPGMPSSMMKLVAERSDKVKVTTDEDAGTVTFQQRNEAEHDLDEEV